jgi:hypothetical protein
MIQDLATERAARAIWRALHPKNEIRPWDAFERETYLQAALAAQEALRPQSDGGGVLPAHMQIAVIPHLGRVT